MSKAVLLGVILCLYPEITFSKLNGKNPKYSNLWVAKIDGGEEVAQRVARDLGYTYKGQCGDFEEYYELLKEDLPQVSLRDNEHLTTSLLDIDEVKWTNQLIHVKNAIHPMLLGPSRERTQTQKALSFLKAENRKMSSKSKAKCESIFSCITYYSPRIFSYLSRLGQGDLKKLGTFPTTQAPKEQLFTYSRYFTKPIGLFSQKISAYILRYTDPNWVNQWNMQDYRTEDMPVMDINVVPVHKLGYTGKGVTVAVVDTGVDHGNPEFKNNFIRRISYDYCKYIPGSQPTGDSHGANCAGVIAMNPDNGICGVGIAYKANIVGIRAICSIEVSPASTAKALRHRITEIDVYSNSWGLHGEGLAIFPKDHLFEESMRQGVTKGRAGKGVIYVRSAGNDKDVGDNCAVDPHINTPYAITIAGATQFGAPTYYSERCAAIMAAAYSRSASREGIVAPNIGGTCRTDFGGTSAACPQASGIIALVLEANPDLTYRDVMHLITMSAEVAPLADNENTWYKNARGFWVSNDFGFGLMNAENMVNLATNWINVPEKRECIVSIDLENPEHFDKSKKSIITFETTACKGTKDEVNYLEQIELSSIVEYPVRGDIVVFIMSPSGTRSQLLEQRPKDKDPDGLEGWPIMSTHYWGEVPQGTWRVVYKISRRATELHSGSAHSLTLTLHGTKEKPTHYNQERDYAAFRLPDGYTS